MTKNETKTKLKMQRTFSTSLKTRKHIARFPFFRPILMKDESSLKPPVPKSDESDGWAQKKSSHFPKERKRNFPVLSWFFDLLNTALKSFPIAKRKISRCCLVLSPIACLEWRQLNLIVIGSLKCDGWRHLKKICYAFVFPQLYCIIFSQKVWCQMR